MQFDFFAPNRIVFGNGSLKKVEEIAPALGKHALVVCGSGSVPSFILLQIMEAPSIDVEIFRVKKEPDVPIIRAGLAKSRASNCDFVIGYGGGSVLDAAKAIAALMTNSGDIFDYLEVVGKGRKIKNTAAKMIALPTTAGTGTEVTKNAVITSPHHHVKVSMRSPKMIPTVAIVDPELTYTLPPSVTATTGMDALTQVLEAYVSIRANPLTDIVAKEGIKRGARSLYLAFKYGLNKEAREDMAMTSLYGGLALANSGLGAVHGFAGPIGGMFNAPHGAICASLLPYVMKYNVRVLTQMKVGGEIRNRYQEISSLLTGNPDATIEEGVRWVVELAEALGIPGLHAIGVEKFDFDQIIAKSKVSSSMQNNPVALDDKTLAAILMEAF
ncbi:MAG: iron-containing alcohol dehydrogenase [Chloroflexota bacterium]|nr:iron-containing alcohol dehydrogenase [Chloroflexota bacterium]